VGKNIVTLTSLKKQNISSGPSTILRFDHLVEQYPDKRTLLEFEKMHKSELDHRHPNADAVHFVSIDESGLIKRRKNHCRCCCSSKKTVSRKGQPAVA